MSTTKDKKQTSTLRKLNDWIHLWLGLFSGIIVFIVSLTGCIYVFQQDIKDLLEPWRFIEVQPGGFIPPTQILKTAEQHMPDQKPTGFTYSNKEGAAAVGYFGMEDGKRTFTAVFVNPYTGEFIKKQQLLGTDEFDFFRFIIDGHRALWLPYNIGRPIVGISTLIFVILLITGIVHWWPKKWNKSNFNKSFKIKWKANFKRVNYDLHNVLGFYSLIFALIIALTGLVWSFSWFDTALYYVSSGGEFKSEHAHPHSDTTSLQLTFPDSLSALDLAYYKTMADAPNTQGIYLEPVPERDEAIEIVAYQDHGSFYNKKEYYYDQYTLERIRVKGNDFETASFADQLYALNYDMHIGSALGFSGKILAFIVSLICASLPITGFLVWWNKKKKSTKLNKSQLQAI